MANRLIDVEVETLVETIAHIYKVLVKKLAYGLRRKVGVEIVNETMGEISTDLGQETRA